jgi:hypothetical protein
MKHFFWAMALGFTVVKLENTRRSWLKYKATKDKKIIYGELLMLFIYFSILVAVGFFTAGLRMK